MDEVAMDEVAMADELQLGMLRRDELEAEVLRLRERKRELEADLVAVAGEKDELRFALLRSLDVSHWLRQGDRWSAVREFMVATHPTRAAPGPVADPAARLFLTLVVEQVSKLLRGALDDVWRPALVDGRGEGENLDEVVGRLLALVEDAPVRLDLVALARRAADLDYVVEALRQALGVDGGPVFRRVHEANMRKLGAGGSCVRRADGKVLKPEGWQPPDVAAELRRQGWEG